MQLTGALLGPSSKNNLPPPPKKETLYFGKWDFLALILKDFLYFLIICEIEKNQTRKKFLIFPEMAYISDSKIEKFLIFSQKKSVLIFLEMEPCTFQPKLEK